MSHLNLSALSDPRAVNFLEQNPSISQSLLADADHDISRVATLIGPILDAPNRCEISAYYIQAVTTGRTAFLTTNLPDRQSTHATGAATSWLIGRDRSCAITIRNPSISRCHAVIGHCSERGFFIMDVGSSNGTFLNRRRLAALEQRFLSDGDLVELSNVRAEFFVSGAGLKGRSLQDTHVG